MELFRGGAYEHRGVCVGQNPKAPSKPFPIDRPENEKGVWPDLRNTWTQESTGNYTSERLQKTLGSVPLINWTLSVIPNRNFSSPPSLNLEQEVARHGPITSLPV